jgi:hypothetical protein
MLRIGGLYTEPPDFSTGERGVARISAMRI